MKSMPSKALTRRSLTLLATAPREFLDRATDEAEVWWTDRHQSPPSDAGLSLDEAVAGLEGALGLEIAPFLDEPALAEVTRHVRRSAEELRESAPFPLYYNASAPMARLLYAVCRATRPATVLETGVAYGTSSAHLLAALRANGHGRLVSVDRPPFAPEAARFVGALVPDELRGRWELHPGTSKRVLPRLLPQLETVDVFVRDSLFSNRTVIRELRTVTPRLSSPGIVISDDVQRTKAFRTWVAEAEPAWSARMGVEGFAQRQVGLGVMGAPRGEA